VASYPGLTFSTPEDYYEHLGSVFPLKPEINLPQMADIGTIVVSARIRDKKKPIALAKWLETSRLKPKAVLEIDGEIRGYWGPQNGPEMKNPPTPSGDFISLV